MSQTFDVVADLPDDTIQLVLQYLEEPLSLWFLDLACISTTWLRNVRLFHETVEKKLIINPDKENWIFPLKKFVIKKIKMIIGNDKHVWSSTSTFLKLKDDLMNKYAKNLTHVEEVVIFGGYFDVNNFAAFTSAKKIVFIYSQLQSATTPIIPSKFQSLYSNTGSLGITRLNLLQLRDTNCTKEGVEHDINTLFQYVENDYSVFTAGYNNSSLLDHFSDIRATSANWYYDALLSRLYKPGTNYSGNKVVYNLFAKSIKSNSNLQYFLDRLGTDFNVPDCPPLILTALTARDIKVVEYFLDSGVDLYKTDVFQSCFGRIGVVHKLLTRGYDPSKSSPHYISKILQTIATSHLYESSEAIQYVVNALIKYDPYLKTGEGTSILEIILDKDPTRHNIDIILKSILEKGYDKVLEKPTSKGETHLQLAMKSKYTTVQQLFDWFCPFNQKGTVMAIFKLACARESTEFVQKLIELEPDCLTIVDPDDQSTLLHDIGRTVEENVPSTKLKVFEKTCKILLSRPEIDINAQDEDGDTILHLALMHYNQPYATMIAEHPKINLKLKNKKGRTVMHELADIEIDDGRKNKSVWKFTSQDKQEWMKYFIDCGCDVNERDNSGETVLFCALRTCDGKLAKYLITELNADVNIRSNKNESPVEVLREKSTYARINNTDSGAVFQAMFSHGLELSTKYAKNNTLLHVFCNIPHLCKIIAKMNAKKKKKGEKCDANAMNDDGKTALNLTDKKYDYSNFMETVSFPEIDLSSEPIKTYQEALEKITGKTKIDIAQVKSLMKGIDSIVNSEKADEYFATDNTNSPILFDEILAVLFTKAEVNLVETFLTSDYMKRHLRNHYKDETNKKKMLSLFLNNYRYRGKSVFHYLCEGFQSRGNFEKDRVKILKNIQELCDNGVLQIEVLPDGNGLIPSASASELGMDDLAEEVKNFGKNVKGKNKRTMQEDEEKPKKKSKN